ncbi:MAG: hypothetical protein P4L61_01235 [Candidatus Pacebacteria bacterium]|nr:hypothetical protein [Candidatus Paceibacterota bacterium]
MSQAGLSMTQYHVIMWILIVVAVFVFIFNIYRYFFINHKLKEHTSYLWWSLTGFAVVFCFWLFVNVSGGASNVNIVLSMIIVLSPPMIMIALFVAFIDLWVEYNRASAIFKQEHVIVEIKLPKEMMKSPASMELFLTALHQTAGEGGWFGKYWHGKTRAWFSLELISVEGQIHFFIWMRKSLKNFISTSLYAQFPGIEVHDAADYAMSVHYDPKIMKIWAADLQYSKEDAYPLMSYVDYGLDKDPKEEFKIDPIAPVIEFLGSIGANQQAWIQILVRAYKKSDHVEPGSLFKKYDKRHKEAEALVNKLHRRDPKTHVAGASDEDSGFSKMPRITKGEEEIISAIERNVTKLGFDVGIRLMYIAKKENFNSSNPGGMQSMWKQYSAPHMNSLGTSDDLWFERIDMPWEDMSGRTSENFSRQALEMYKRRSYFFPPYTHIHGHLKPMIMSSESLATIYHFPGAVVATPTLSRVPSKKGEAPANIPV